MGRCRKILTRFFFALALMQTSAAFAHSYRQAVEDYSEQKFSRSYRKAILVAREESGRRRGRALVLAAAAALELDHEERARGLFQKALGEDPELEIPSVVKSKRAQRFFADVRDGKDQNPAIASGDDPPPAFDQFETYLPFGMNQLLQKKFLLGLTLGSIQAFGIYNAYEKSEAADAADRKGRSTTKIAIQTGNDINPVFKKFLAKNKSFSQKARQESQISLLLAIASYGGSVMEAGFNPPLANRFALLVPTSIPLLAQEQAHSRWQLDMMNPLSSLPSLQLSLFF